MAGSTVTEELEVRDVGGGGAGFRGADDGGWSGGSGGAHAIPRRTYFTGMAIGLAAILMFFMALTSAYIVRKGLGGDWQVITLPRILWLNTLVLLASSVTIEQARRQFSRGEPSGFRQWWGITTALGITFLLGQILAWRQLAAAGVFLASNPSSSFFYVLTGAHGLHLLGGVVALVYVALRARQFTRMAGSIAAEVSAIYWHFMDGLWVFLFLLLHLGR